MVHRRRRVQVTSIHAHSPEAQALRGSHPVQFLEMPFYPDLFLLLSNPRCCTIIFDSESVKFHPSFSTLTQRCVIVNLHKASCISTSRRDLIYYKRLSGPTFHDFGSLGKSKTCRCAHWEPRVGSLFHLPQRMLYPGTS